MNRDTIREALVSARAAIWDKHYASRLTLAYMQEVDAEIRTALAELDAQEAPQVNTDGTDRRVKTGQEFFNLMERTAARVEKWPAWKKGERSERQVGPVPPPASPEGERGDGERLEIFGLPTSPSKEPSRG
jgi:hypothetical protein